MAINRMPIAQFVAQLAAALARGGRYIMGARGQDPRKWAEDSWWFTQYSGAQRDKALYWREHAARVWDCNGLAEGIYEDYSGVNINTKARYNYANWCGVKAQARYPPAIGRLERRCSGATARPAYIMWRTCTRRWMQPRPKATGS